MIEYYMLQHFKMLLWLSRSYRFSNRFRFFVDIARSGRNY